MGFLIRADGTEHALTDGPLTVGCAQSATIRVEGVGVEAVHLSIDATRIEALADCIVGGVPMKAGASRAVVPCAIAIGSASLAIEATDDSEELSTRERVLGAVAGPGMLCRGRRGPVVRKPGRPARIPRVSRR